jgi:hypothetical protein
MITGSLTCIALYHDTGAQVPGGTQNRAGSPLDDIIALDTWKFGRSVALTEGPVWVPAAAGRTAIFYLATMRQTSFTSAPNSPLFLENSGFTGRDNSKVGAQTVAGRSYSLRGSNGLALDPQGRLV